MVQPFQRTLVLLTSSDELEVKLRIVLHRPFFLKRVKDWADLRSALLESTQAALCFADAMEGEGSERALSEELQEIAHEFPHIPLVACLDIDPFHDAEVLTTLQSWGIAEVIDLRREQSEAALARRLDEVKSFWVQRIVERAFPRFLGTRARALVEAIAEVAADGGHVPELARAFGIDERTVPRWCNSAGLPNGRRLFTWIRLLLAAELLDQPRLSIEVIARVSGYSSAASFKSATKKFTSFTPTELRRRGAFNVIAELLRAELHEAREESSGSRKNERNWFN